MLGQVKKVSVAGEKDDDIQTTRRPLLDAEVRERTDELLLAAAEVDYQEEIVRQREEGINHIQRDVNKIHDLFQDVAMHVTQQGEMLDNIEANVTNARDETGAANQQLLHASRRAPSARQNFLCFLLILFIILVAVAMVKGVLAPPFIRMGLGGTPYDSDSWQV
jgi:t-SNARE complex subunit (syntaxin)